MRNNIISKKLLACVIGVSVFAVATNEADAADVVEYKAKENVFENDIVFDTTVKEIIGANKEKSETPNVPSQEEEKESESEESDDESPANNDIGTQIRDESQDSETTRIEAEIDEKETEDDISEEEASNVIEWEKVSEEGLDPKETVRDGKRYNELESTLNNDNANNTANYKKNGLETDESGNTTVNIDFIDDSEEGSSRFGVFLYHEDNSNNIFVGYDRGGWFWEYKLDGKGEYYKGARVAAPKRGEENQLSISIKKDGQLNATNNGNNVFDTTVIPSNVYSSLINNRSVLLKLGTYGDEKTKILVKTDNQENVKEEEKIPEHSDPVNDSEAIYDTIASEEMTAVIDTVFPRVKEYHYEGQKFSANVNFTDTLQINGIDVKPDVTYEKIAPNEAKYILEVKDEEHFINAVLDVRMKILENQLHFDIVDIINNYNIDGGDIIDNPLKLISFIDFGDNFLASVSSDDEKSKFDGARMSVNTHVNGDVHIDVTNPMEDINPNAKGYMYGFVSDSNLVAAVRSNSQYYTGGGANDYTRLSINKKTYGDTNYLGISSSAFLYQLAFKNGDGSYKVFDERTWDKPSSKVVIANDLNNDENIDWQDGAIAYRDIMNNPKGSEYVKDLVGQRISMNFGSQAQNPFLTTLDGIKKVYLNTDGLGQMVLLKGYGSEGHDSGHLNYADIGKRMGGVEDFNKLLELASKYGARIGIHVNASETYPESKYFEVDRLMKDNNGNFKYGWNWLDQGININALYDLAYGRFDRFNDLKEIVGDNLDFVYVDVWGNGQSGDNSAWTTHQLAKELNDLGWRTAFEWGYAGEYDSTFQHWAADLTYGGYSLKGINSNIVRFIRNHQKDSWIGNYPAYGGAAINPLLGGYDMIDFEGWQGRNDWAGFIDNIFRTNLPTKFIQHYQVYEWINGDPIKMNDNGESYTRIPEMEIKLRKYNDDSSYYDELIIDRKSNDINDDGYYQRTMTLNKKVVFDEGKYLLPWEDGNVEKLYHFNPDGGQTVWEVLDGWNGEVYVYELTDLGKTNEKIVEIKDGKITLDSKAGVGYVIYKEKPENEDIKWSEGMGIYDVGFNSKSLDHWEIEGDKDKAQVVLSQGANPILRIQDNEQEVSLTQKITGLKQNTQYAIYVGVDNRSDANAFIEVKDGDKTYSNYTEKSIAKNYVQANAHNTLQKSATVDDSSYFQNMYVYFTTGDNPENISVTLRRDPGQGATYFDDLRVFENKSTMYEDNHDIKEGYLFQDFENVGQGIFPFVIGPVEGVTDNRTHLAEKHEPYTQSGWNGKVIDDVIDGNWSLKTNGLTEGNSLVYQTIPQNFRFEPGKTYEVSFDYASGSDGTYAFVVGDGEYSNISDLTVHKLDKTWQENKEESSKRVTFLIKGSDSGKSWVGILSTDIPSDDMGTSGNEANFRSYKDFMLDNLLIRQTEVNDDLIVEAFESQFNTEDNLEKYTSESVKEYQQAIRDYIENIDTWTNKQKAKQIEVITEKEKNLEIAINKIQYSNIEKVVSTIYQSQTMDKAFDGNSQTIFHSANGGDRPGTPIEITLKDELEIERFEYLPRQSGNNGRIKSAILTLIDKDGNKKEFTIEQWDNNADLKILDFDGPVKVKKIILDTTSSYGNTKGENDKFVSAAEFNFILKGSKPAYKGVNYNLLKYVIDKIELNSELKANNPKLYSIVENIDSLIKYKALSYEDYLDIKEDIEKLASSGQHITEESNNQEKTDEYDMFYPTYNNSDYYRIPALVILKDGTMIAGADQRHTTEADWGDIDAVIRIKKPQDVEFSEPIKVFDRPESNSNEEPFTIDMEFLPVYEGENAGRVYMLIDSFRSGGKYWSSQSGSGYENIYGKNYLLLFDKDNNKFTVRKDGIVYNDDGEKTNYRVKTTDIQPFMEIGDLYYNDNLIGNVYKDSSILQVHQTPYLWLTYSDDSGQTWQSPIDLTPQVKNDERMKFLGTSPGRGIQLQSGRLLFPLYFGTNPGKADNKESSTFIYSDDGINWYRSETNPNDSEGYSSLDGEVKVQNSENQVVQLNNGTIISFMRSPGNNQVIYYAISLDDGVNRNNGLREVDFKSHTQNNLSVIKYDKDGKEYIILSNSNPGARVDGVIKVMEVELLENGDFNLKTISKKQINSGDYSYSSIEKTPVEGVFALLYEGSDLVEGQKRTSIKYTEFNWNWLLG
ncbi:MAG: endo-alpha-N-acetylgalactosaminidase family protein, partial [Peptoniphilaceae bacterium]|nr:endo-alpha-N-acetylgalactosaminidase family protein [Peptoniphilaceae bacterium]